VSKLIYAELRRVMTLFMTFIQALFISYFCHFAALHGVAVEGLFFSAVQNSPDFSQQD